MNSDEMMLIITHGEWFNPETNNVCTFSWSDSDQSINIEYLSGDKAGRKKSHQLVKIYQSQEALQNCTVLRYQSNLFTTEFKLCSEEGPLSVVSNVFGKMELIRR
ncbi:hypothetical protein [Ancylomarina longa]|uniref:Uncharacterized protein n=1 Tax=Ancylomarina longa TaxID=2487017 RepID=A0A434AZX7_9BACT|nr:hypothetical protein [Ancylomarina longa]RUT80017.1 hypothetical protein DLK05_01285 [Ancylomarina longa]